MAAVKTSKFLHCRCRLFNLSVFGTETISSDEGSIDSFFRHILDTILLKENLANTSKSDIRVSEYLKTVLFRNRKWSKYGTQTAFPVSRRRNGAHRNYPKLPLSLLKRLSNLHNN